MAALLKLVSSGGAKGMRLATPCRSFSIARRAPPASAMPSAVCSPDHIWGFSNLSDEDRKVCMEGNQLAKATCKLVRQAIQYDVPFMIENPASSMLWSIPFLRHLSSSKFA
eukprot:2163344-Pyramimonas_sp.AAC.1